MATDFTTYVCVVPTRWDTIARDRYGIATKIDVLIAANPGIPASGYIPQGTTVNCPVLDIETTSETIKPPWA